VQLKQAKHDQVRELERLSGLSASQARQLLLRELEDELRHDSARVARHVEEEVRRDAERRARSILATAMQRIASGHAAETTVSVVQLPSDELKGRIIGREGRNIRALETLTGVDFIIDDTPSAVLLSGFDPVRREIARITLERLIQDGRIHPARIEEAFHQAKGEIEKHMADVGEQAALEANVGQVHPELTKILGRLHYRTSYGQNVLAHSIECSHLAGMIASELGASVKTARRAALMHDIGKALTHELDGSHAVIGADIARRLGEPELVANAIGAHHTDEPFNSPYAYLVAAADAMSGARPGARRQMEDNYVGRLEDLQRITRTFRGIEEAFAVQGGREVRIYVQEDQVDDLAAVNLSTEVAKKISAEMTFPGQIRVTVIREFKATETAS
jgi:ribonuclease Y